MDEQGKRIASPGSGTPASSKHSIPVQAEVGVFETYKFETFHQSVRRAPDLTDESEKKST
jgi:hypothetical protein